MFQSPSLRGSGRFRTRVGHGRGGAGVSIPFIAGQWSLRRCWPSWITSPATFQSPSLRGSGRFPQRCCCGGRRSPTFQSPSLRGSGRFPSSARFSGRFPLCFNPLHCGAVVASSATSFRRTRPCKVSIPFIAGQWSLPLNEVTVEPTSPGFNPLHCGAVVASRRHAPRHIVGRNVSIPFIAGQWSLLLFAHYRFFDNGRVSIPFIAGQWSLRGFCVYRQSCLQGLNPLHCGAVVASKEAKGVTFTILVSQSPSLRGSGRFHESTSCSTSTRRRLNPLHCGAVVASNARLAARRGGKESQSPSLRGSGRFTPAACGRMNPRMTSQSPSLRGSGRFECPARRTAGGQGGLNPLHCGAVVASRCRGGPARSNPDCLNPLHCGAVVASQARLAARRGGKEVSIPFIAGQWSLLDF